LDPITRFGLRVRQPFLPSPTLARQRQLIASPASMTASLDPTVETPIALLGSSSRCSMAAVAGYSSLSIMFLSNVSAISFSASGSIHVVTNVARFRRELPSSISSSWMKR
jgi:hypothetical protein